jgi:hypothetical protein
MSGPKLSLKLLKTIVNSAKGEITYNDIVEELDRVQAAYNEPMLQGVLLQSLSKGHFEQKNKSKDMTKGVFGPKPRQSTGGGTPTTMFTLSDPLNPGAKSKFEEQPYDKETVDAKGSLWGTTKLAAVKAAKAHFYNTEYWPRLEQYRLLEEANGAQKAPVEEDNDAAAA